MWQRYHSDAILVVMSKNLSLQFRGQTSQSQLWSPNLRRPYNRSYGQDHIQFIIIPMENTFSPPVSFPSARLLSLAKSSLTESSGKFVAGTHPDTNPEQAPGLFSALLTGEKALPDRWAVRLFVGIIMCLCVGMYGS